MKKYIELAPNHTATHLKIEFYYDLGGLNYFTYKNESRGYYLSVTPVTRELRQDYVTESYGAFTGIKHCLKDVTRKSKKAESEALKAVERWEPRLIAYVLQQNELELLEVQAV